MSSGTTHYYRKVGVQNVFSFLPALLTPGAAPLILLTPEPHLLNRRVLCVKGCEAAFAVGC